MHTGLRLIAHSDTGTLSFSQRTKVTRLKATVRILTINKTQKLEVISSDVKARNLQDSITVTKCTGCQKITHPLHQPVTEKKEENYRTHHINCICLFIISAKAPISVFT